MRISLLANTVPFLFRFAERLPESECLLLRYDAARQISQACVSGRWVDAPDVREGWPRGTRFTEVQAETTDDR